MHHILTIDDEPGIRDLLSQVLISNGYRVTATETAAEALDVARRESRRRAAAGYAGGGGPGQPDQVGGGQFDLQAPPPGGDVDRREP